MARRNPPAKWVLPDVVHPPDHICFKIPVPNNRYYLAAFRGALLNLCSATQWGDDLAHTAREVANVWRDIYDQVVATACETPVPIDRLEVEFDTMASIFDVYCDDQGNCHAEFRCSLCDPYIELATKADLITNPPGTGIQPKPGGGISNYCNSINGNGGGLVIPIPVSTGDKIEIVSSTGNWGDGSLAQYCIDGNTFFIECTGVGAAVTGSPDFLTTAIHMSAIARFSTGYFAIYPTGSLIVPAGITREMPVILANKSSGDGNGAIDACFKITNNQTATWCKFYDFTTSPYDWLNSGGSTGTWVGGVGWVGDFESSSSQSNCTIGLTFPSTTITAVDMEYNRDAGLDPNSTNNIGYPFPATTILISDNNHTGAPVHLVYSGSVTTTGLRLNCNTGSTAGISNIVSVKLSGTGTPPPGGVVC